MNKILKKEGTGGYVLITALIFFLAAGTAVIAGISDGVVREMRTVRNESLSKQSYFASESALEDALYRIKGGKQIGSTEALAVASSSASVTIVDTDSDTKTVSSLADASGTKRNTQASVDITSGVSFPYAVQTGVGGIDLAAGVSITGDIYTSGSIRSSGAASISGLAVAAEKATIAVDQDNSTPETPTQSITFGNSTASQDMAMSFKISSTTSLMDISFYIKKVGNPANATVKITADSHGSPNFYNPLASGTVSSSFVSTSYDWEDITLTANPILTSGTTYWIVIDANADASSYYMMAANTSYLNGAAKVGRGDTGSWNNTSPSGLDAYFKASIGSNTIGIAGDDTYNRLSVGSAYANQVSFVNASGIIYCQEGGSNNKDCDTSRADPVVASLPVTDSLITSWKDEAAAGGTVTSQTVGWAGATLGPKKINGNLSVSGGGQLRISGTLWVTGTVSISGGASVTSANSSKSYAIISDSGISLSGGSDILGSANSHILLLSTSSADPAISLDGGANDTVLFAPNGIIRVSGGATAKAAAAKRLYVSGGATIIYDPAVSALNLSSGSASTTSNIKSWKETE